MPTVTWKFEGDSTDLEQALTEVGQQVGTVDEGMDKLGGSTKKSSDNMEEGGEKAAKAAKIMGGVFLASVVAATAAALGLAKAVVDFSAKNNQIQKTADEFGTTAEEVQKLEGALGILTDGSANASTTLKFLSKNLAEAADGTGPAKDALDKLGLSAEDLIDLPLTEQIARIGDAMPGLSSHADRTQVSLALMGRAGSSLVPAFKNGGDALRATTKTIEEHGIVSTKTARESEVLQDKMTLAKASFANLANVALTELQPALIDVVDAAKEIVLAVDTSKLAQYAGVLADVTMGAVLAARAVGLFGIAQRDSDKETRENAQAAIRDQSEQVVALKEQLAALKGDGVHIATVGWTAYQEEVAAATAEIDKQSRVLNRLNGELGAEAGLIVRGAKALKEGTKERGLSVVAISSEADAVEDAEARKKEAHEKGIEDLARKFKQEQAMTEREESWWAQVADSQEAREKESQAQREANLQAHYDEREDMARESARQQIEIERTVATTILSVVGQLADGIISSLRKLNQERTKDVKERQKREVFLAILLGEIQAGLAFATTLAQFPGGATPAAYAAAAAAAIAVSAATKISAGAAASTTMHGGGLIRASDIQGSSMDSVTVQAKPGEGFLSATGVASVGGEAGVNAANAGRSPGGGGESINVFRFGTRTTEAISHQQLQSQTGKMQSALRGVRPRVGRSIPGRR